MCVCVCVYGKSMGFLHNDLSKKNLYVDSKLVALYSGGIWNNFFNNEEYETFRYNKVAEHCHSLPLCAKSSSDLPILEGTYEKCRQICGMG